MATVYLHRPQLEELADVVEAIGPWHADGLFARFGVCPNGVKAIAGDCARGALAAITAGTATPESASASSFVAGVAVGLLAGERVGR